MPLGWAANPVTDSDAAVDGGWDGDVPVGDNCVGNGDDDDDEMDADPASAVATSAPTNGPPANGGGGTAAAAGDDVDVVHRFLPEFDGVPENIVNGGRWAGRAGYV